MSEPRNTGQQTQDFPLDSVPAPQESTPASTVVPSSNPASTPQPRASETADFSPESPPAPAPAAAGHAATMDVEPGSPAADPNLMTEGNLRFEGLTQSGRSERPASGNFERPTVDGYEILDELGRGGMGVVYKARQIKLDRIVALKMVLAGAHAGPDQLARFHTEAQAVAHLQHPNIIQIYEVGEQSGLPFFALEFVDGGSLSDKCAGKPQPVNEAAQLMETLSRAMHHAHQHNVVHRDLKPLNILLTKQGEPKITDFGLAKRLEGESSIQTRDGSILGTPSYMAPEQATGEIQKIGPLTDVYSMGAMLYELLTGRPPFLAATPMETVMQVVRDEPVPPSQLQPGLARDVETICLKCLQKDQAKRYASAGELADDLRRFLAGEPILARPVSAPERLWRWCRRNPRTAGLSAAVLLLLVTVAVVSTTMAFQIAHERDQTERERQEAVNARALADENAAIAEENARIAAEQGELAVESLYKVVTKIQSRLSDKPALRTLRQELLDEATDGLKRVANTESSSALVSRTKAAALQSMGDIALYLGQLEQAFEHFSQMHRILSALAEAEPENPQALRNLAISNSKLGEVSDRLGRTAEAVKHYEECLRLRERWHSLEPENPNIKQANGETYGRLARIFLLSGDPKKSLDYCLKSLKIRQEAVSREPGSELAALDLAALYSILGEVSVRLNDPVMAREYSDKYVKQFEELADANLENNTIQSNRLVAYVRSADLMIQLRENEMAGVYYSKAVAPLQALLSEDSQNALVKRNLSIVFYGLGVVSQRAGDSAAAADHFQNCLTLRRELAERDQQDVRAQTDLMLVLPRCGEHAEGSDVAEKLREKLPKSQRNLYNIACCYAICVAAARDSDQTLGDKYTNQAFTALRDAISLGYKAAGQLQTDPDLDPIREHPDFLRIIDELTGAEGPPR